MMQLGVLAVPNKELIEKLERLNRADTAQMELIHAQMALQQSVARLAEARMAQLETDVQALQALIKEREKLIAETWEKIAAEEVPQTTGTGVLN